MRAGNRFKFTKFNQAYHACVLGKVYIDYQKGNGELVFNENGMYISPFCKRFKPSWAEFVNLNFTTYLNEIENEAG